MKDKLSYFESRYPPGYFSALNSVQTTQSAFPDVGKNRFPWEFFILTIIAGIVVYQLLEYNLNQQLKKQTNQYE